ncbi:MAG: hypothetical protein A3A80_04265 [Candidatus Terrybacteria bacterium RIFCSPLOWO2_01_FULL_44_24]|uniref:Restriction endonuclease n=1 Tax=Candidatus Terrybacteria bacterium RIFCSPHIGHO2_01_FULL_43_35 TaxID=1802361 RepID=A0A1G2PDT5_9BACT|nr:MAG: hypothetical protein A2828_01140 [Candidatus Terrybacteria bacterium RIFCSPHIGHO2_01_FULL_43_35]OHA51849.1 MAG: hypothetical protein A3A80_04265 [Candidatus Terrybacteria bacterium RIFCSPLOWO2_01_FULL_44_24]
MNRWVQKSKNLAKNRGYLDNLNNIYPVQLTFSRPVSKKNETAIRQAFSQKNNKALISVLLTLKKFPIDDPYVGFFRKYPTALNLNPKTTNRIGKKLFKLGLRGVLDGASKPKIPSRQFGQTFRKYLLTLGYPILAEPQFITFNGKAFLDGGDATLKKFARKNLKYNRNKGLDLIFKTKNKFVIGEAKFISAGGGTQDKSFREAMQFIKGYNQNILRIAVLDGVVWLPPKRKNSLYGKIRKINNKYIAISALLLKDFLKNI